MEKKHHIRERWSDLSCVFVTITSRLYEKRKSELLSKLHCMAFERCFLVELKRNMLVINWRNCYVKYLVAPVPVSGIWVEHALLMAFLLVASAILFVTRSESSFPVAIKAFHYLDVPWFIVLTLLLAWWQCSVLPRPYFRRRRLFFASSTWAKTVYPSPCQHVPEP